jgi:hypothetical protein
VQADRADSLETFEMSALQKQLAAVAMSGARQLDLKAQKEAHAKSLFWDVQQAARQGFNELYGTCINQFRVLLNFAPHLAVYEETIFHGNSISVDRDLLLAEENEKLDQTIEAMLVDLTPFIAQKSGQYALEWLIRRFRFVTVSLHVSTSSDYSIGFMSEIPNSLFTLSYPFTKAQPSARSLTFCQLSCRNLYSFFSHTEPLF